jgi:EmrB/QacA subfamily drug resistance transporter
MIYRNWGWQYEILSCTERIFIISLYIFTISSVFCGMAQTLPELVIARIFQGLGGSIMLPVGRLIIVRTYQKKELITIMNQVVIVGALGMMLGPMLGGFITHYLSWRWIFFVNIPVGLLNIMLAQRWLVATEPQLVHRLDKLGFILFGLGLASLTFGLSALSETAIDKSLVTLILLLAGLLLLFYFRHSRKQIHPIVNTALFNFRTFSVSAAGNLLARLGFGGLPFLIPLLLQIGFGYSPQVSGLLLAPTALGVLVAKPLSLSILRLLGYKDLLIWNTLAIGLSLGLFALVDAKTSIVIIAFFTFLFGFLSALQYTGMNSLAYSEISGVHFSSATSVMSTLQQLAQSFGVAVSAILLQVFSRISPHSDTITVYSLHYTFITMGILTSFSVLIFMQLSKDDGRELL